MNDRDADYALIGRPTDTERAQGARLRALAAEWDANSQALDERIGGPWGRGAATVLHAAKQLDGDEDRKIRIPLTEVEAVALTNYMDTSIAGSSLTEKWRRAITYVDRGTDPATGEPYIDLVSRTNFYALDVAEALDWVEQFVAPAGQQVLRDVQRKISDNHHRAAARAAAETAART